MTSDLSGKEGHLGLFARLNGALHRPALFVFMTIVLAHWAEHLAQAAQIWLLGWDRPESRGLLGVPFPWLIESEWLHYGYAVLMLAGLWILRRGFVGRSLGWWMAALMIQVWHHVEHFALLIQAMAGANLAGSAAPTSFLQLVIPRVELHLVYNAAVFAPMVIAMMLHLRPRDQEREMMRCDCARTLVGSRAS
jgi:hypothetical protein